MKRDNITENEIRNSLAEHVKRCSRFGRAAFPDERIRRIAIQRGLIEQAGSASRSSHTRKEFRLTTAGEAMIG